MQIQPSPLALRRPRRRPLVPLWLVATMLGAGLLASLVVGELAFTAVRGLRAASVLPVPRRPAPAGTAAPRATSATQATPMPGALPEAGLQCPRLAERTTVLLMGIDEREADPGASRTDTMMLLSLEPGAQSGVMLSIPRDLWVTIPDYGYGQAYNRINAANLFGDAYRYPGGGPALAAKTVLKNLGIGVDHYVRVDFKAFETFIDRIGGIDVVLSEDIYDPQYPTPDGGYEVFQISAGAHHVDGATALKISRTRHTPGSDFDRARRQQQVILAVRERITSLRQLPGLVAQAPALYADLRDGVQTDLGLDDMVCLARAAQDVPPGRIRSAVIDASYTTPWKTEQGWDVLVPNRPKIERLIRSLYPDAPAPTSTPDSGWVPAPQEARAPAGTR